MFRRAEFLRETHPYPSMYEEEEEVFKANAVRRRSRSRKEE